MEIRTSPLVAAASEARRPTRWWAAYAFSILVPALVVGGIVGYIAFALTGVEPGSESLPQQLVEGVVWVSTAATLALWVAVKERRPVRSLGFIGSGGLRRFGLGMAVGAGLMTVVTVLSVALGQHELVEQPETLTGMPAVVPAVLLVVVWVVQGSTEEMINRGYQLQVGGLQLPGWAAVLAPAALFAVVHLANEGAAYPLVTVNLLIFALFASFVALSEGSLWLVCGIHASWNWVQGNVFGLPVSGGFRDTSVIRLAEASDASTVLSGGPFGPEGGVISTVVWGIAALTAYQWYRRREAARVHGSAESGPWRAAADES